MMIRAIIEKWGNGSAVRIPAFFMEKVGLSIGDSIDIELKNRSIIIRPTELKVFCLDTLLQEISADNLHNKVGFGSPTGNEQL
ncbi:AbrB/MazE/SpoVT family DNA-binding domain-containing protein [Klebsiella pneumoniae]|uniref:AbrB/MazE/SpoVT family DNA-binding domain-containing protein n=1 Tax=Klebsiella pneumoniae TaxID=573 RepID=UPI001CE21CE6|nr:AbrB/MazE/SpoVT family DNA-binding domain-containing protein [Klebsiella pneumoniae]MCA5535967.1 AbrB/MazE/SpoVT family DNA-binding domain-containing protein [Klebsiella pneumoniae]MEB2424775.1 AbrB/MazE/SpoVT family DNA-binding domain-containing protein [Klebsiella pneumoniae]